jgi:hypothetical protein
MMIDTVDKLAIVVVTIPCVANGEPIGLDILQLV